MNDEADWDSIVGSDAKDTPSGVNAYADSKRRRPSCGQLSAERASNA